MGTNAERRRGSDGGFFETLCGLCVSSVSSVIDRSERRRRSTIGPTLRLVTATLLALVGLGWLVAVGTAWTRCRLESTDPTIQVRDRHGSFLSEVGGGDGLGWWPVDELPERVVAATLALEDRRFADHPGVDVRAIGRA